jgi:lysylphosphatidylglycerol synthetase-like protein (DUF2156 family)
MAEVKKVREGYEIQRPNRGKASSKTMKAIVVLLLLVSVALMVVITVGGWDKLAGAQAVQIAYIAIYVICAFYVARWNRGVLPIVAALAIVMGIFAAVAGPAWFDRDKSGFTDPALPADLLGLLTFLVVPVQLLLIGAAMSAFNQEWNVEVEVKQGETYDPERHGDQGTGSAAPASA